MRGESTVHRGRGGGTRHSRWKYSNRGCICSSGFASSSLRKYSAMPACQRALTSVSAIRLLRGGEVVGFEIADHESVALPEEQRIVAPSRGRQGVEHVGPDVLVCGEIVLHPVRFELQQKAHSLHRLTLVSARARQQASVWMRLTGDSFVRGQERMVDGRAGLG